MRLKIENLGPIKEADIAIKDLNILVGENNTGKTYVAMVLYGLLKRAGREIANRIIEEFLEDESSSNLYSAKVNVNNLEFTLTNPLINSLGVPSREPNTSIATLSEVLKYQDIISILKVVIYEINNSPMFSFILDVDNLSISFNSTNSSTFSKGFNTLDIDPFEFSFIDRNREVIVDGLELGIDYYISNNALPYLISERNTLPLVFKDIDKNRSRLISKLQSDYHSVAGHSENIINKNSSRIPEVMLEFIDTVRDLELTIQNESPLFTGRLQEIAMQLFQGHFLYDSVTSAIQYKSEDEAVPVLPLHMASSSLKDLSMLYFYLRHQAAPGDFIIIDEPESFLTLKKQRIMARLLVAMVNAGIKVWINTHSDFIIREVNNLILLNSDFTGKEEFLDEHQDEYSREDRIKPSRVQVMQAQNGTIIEIGVSEKGIDEVYMNKEISKQALALSELQYLTETSDD